MQDAKKAKEWASKIGYQPCSYEPEEVEVAKFILNLPDQIINADKVRELIASLNAWAEDADAERAHGRALGYRAAAENLAALLPTPPLQTLADMDEDARHAVVGKDVKVEGWNSPSMLIAVHKDEGAVLGYSWVNPWPFVEVRPLSELSPADEGRPEA